MDVTLALLVGKNAIPEFSEDHGQRPTRKVSAMSPRTRRWIKYLIAIVIGNLLYFSLQSHFPRVLQHHPYHADFGMFVDLWFCVAVFGLIDLVVYLADRIRR
jgi:hypothetical protein